MTAKDNDKRLLLIFGCVAVVLCLVAVGWYLAVERGDYKPNPIRPKDFPEILVVPESAEAVDYFSGRGKVKGVYGVSFVAKDPYPSEDTCNLIEKRLISNGWQRLNYRLLGPRTPRFEPGPIPPRLDSASVDFVIPKEKQKGVLALKLREEDWVNRDEELISVFLSYSADLATKDVDRDEVFVDLTFFERESWVRPYILRYRELHPEEFQDGNDL
jgi:hypothetical protein